MQKLKGVYNKIGFPRLIIALFLLILLVSSKVLGLSQANIWNSILVRFGMNSILVLAMVPGIRAGIGVNFNLTLGVVFGLLGALLSIEFGFTGGMGFLMALVIAIPMATVAGILYGLMLNRVKGQEMTVGNYIGLSIVSFMCIIWLLLPFTNLSLTWPMGKGLRTTVSMENSFGHFLNNLWAFPKGTGVFDTASKFSFPTGMILFFVLIAGLLWIFNRSKTGNAMAVSGANESFAISNGLNVNRYRVLGTTISTVLGAIGIVVYAQAFGFLQLYRAPLYMALPAAASILIGGATLKEAKIIHVIIGTFLFQSLLVVALPVINIISDGQMAEIIRIIISNGIILYALTRGGEEE
ncbi:MAG: ABC transporter permease [Tissierellia bacterium]|nr:ABC transporter permease [Tissierellia bacterium]